MGVESWLQLGAASQWSHVCNTTLYQNTAVTQKKNSFPRRIINRSNLKLKNG